MLKIVADKNIPFLKGVLEKKARVVYHRGSEIGPEHVKDADALIVRTRTRCNERLLGGSAVKYIATATIGFDHIDDDYCRDNGIRWSNAAGCNSGSVMQYVASALAFITGRGHRKFSDLTLGIIGVGHVGSKVENLARLLGMRVLLNDPPRERVEGSGNFTDIGRLLRESDVVTLHVPLNMKGEDRTFHMADRRFFGNIKSGAWFINTSRGEVMDTEEVKTALARGAIAGTVLDVWENEPVVDRQLLADACISTPHIAGYSLDGKANGTATSVRAISRFFGLEMDDWYPDEIPAPVNSTIMVENDTGLDDIARNLFLRSYDIQADSSALKSAPGDFEKFRDEYPPRREFHAYSLSFGKPAVESVAVFKKLGFGS